MNLQKYEKKWDSVVSLGNSVVGYAFRRLTTKCL